MFVSFVTLSLRGYTIDHKDIKYKIEDFFSSNGINSKMSFFCKRYLTPPLVRSTVSVVIMFSTVHLSRIIIFQWVMQKCLLSQSVCIANGKLRLKHELTIKQHSV